MEAGTVLGPVVEAAPPIRPGTSSTPHPVITDIARIAKTVTVHTFLPRALISRVPFVVDPIELVSNY
jgi:hypothetical protein